MIRVKICGIRHVEHALTALEAGADMLGFVFYPPSHRYVRPERARAIIQACREHFADWRAVGVFVNLPLDELLSIVEQAGLDMVQLAGDEDAAYCARVPRPVIKVVRVDAAGAPLGPVQASAWNAERVLLDTHRPGAFGGTGQRFDWARVRPFAGEALLAGGLTPTNARQAVRLARPWGLDVSSGVERDREKDPALIRQFLNEVKRHDSAR